MNFERPVLLNGLGGNVTTERPLPECFRSYRVSVEPITPLNGAQEVEGRHTLNGGMDFGSGFAVNVTSVLTSLPLPISTGYQEPIKGESL